MSRIRRVHRKRFPRVRKFFARFRRGTEVTSTEGNRVILYRQGGDFFPALFEAIENSKQTVCLEFYIVRDDHTGRQLAALLAAAVQRGVRAYLLYDYIGSFETAGSFFRGMEKAGVHCVAFNPPPFRRGIAWFDTRDHRKIAVIDGRLAFTGGVNIGEEYAGFGDCPSRWRDLGIRLEGPAVDELQRLFRENWHAETGRVPDGCWSSLAPAAAGESEVMIVSGIPHGARSLIRETFRMAIAGATDSVTLETPYFIPGPRVMRSLLRATRRGVQVRLILPALSDVPLVRLVSRSFYASLLRGGIEIFEREGTILHAKVLLVDDDWAMLGSANLDQRSFHRNFEVNVIVTSREFGDQLADMLAEDLGRSRPVVLAEHERRGVTVRLLERLCATINWFL